MSGAELLPESPRGVMRPAIVGLSGLALTAEETALLAAAPPAGLILFKRNIADPEQLAALVESLRPVLDPRAVLMVDQEGGRVARLRPPHWMAHPPAQDIGALFLRDAAAGRRVAWLTGALIGCDCRSAGFDVAAAPVLDLVYLEGHDVIGDRAYSADPEMVAELARAVADGLLAAGVQPVGKHAPGHGRARADSHLSLPELDGIAPADLVPFRRLADLPWLMTAHIRYISSDMENPATLSAAIIGGVIRAPSVRGPDGVLGGGIGFDGVLVSDDLAMHALTGPAGERAARAIAAGCDVALHCSGVLEETRDVLDSVPAVSGAAERRLAAARALAASSRRVLDPDALARERSALLAA